MFQLSYKTARMFFYIITYPFLGKEFFVNRRGVVPELNQAKVFNSVFDKLNAVKL